MKKHWKLTGAIGVVIGIIIAAVFMLDFGRLVGGPEVPLPEVQANIIVGGNKIIFRDGQSIMALPDGSLLFTDKDATTTLKEIKDLKEKVNVLEDDIKELKEAKE